METLTIAGFNTSNQNARNGVNPDRPDRKSADDRQLWQAMLNATQQGIIYADSKGIVKELNTCAAELLKREKQEVIGAKFIQLFPAEHSERLQDIFSDFRLLPFKDHHLVKLDLDDHPVDLQFTSLRGRDDSFRGIVVNITDRSETQQLQQRQQSLENNLMQAYKLASIGMLASGIAHNLNGPLSVIVGYLDLLNTRMADSPEIPLILAQAERMKEIIATVMLKSRNAQEIRTRSLNINEVIENELKFFEANMIFKHKIEKVYHLSEELPPIEGIYSDFSQCFSNIIHNAIDAMHLSSVKKLTVSTHSDDQNVYVEFEDTGVGLEPKDVEKLFIPFYSTKAPIDETGTGKPTGTGLGLYSARQLLSKYGGMITVDGVPNQGAHFTVVIPLHGKPAEIDPAGNSNILGLEDLDLRNLNLDDLVLGGMQS